MAPLVHWGGGHDLGEEEEEEEEGDCGWQRQEQTWPSPDMIWRPVDVFGNCSTQFFFPFLNPSATWFSCWTINERPLCLKRGLWVRCEVGGIVKSWLNGLEPVTWTHSCISRRGREHSPPRAGPPVNAERRVLQPQNNGAPCWCNKEAAAVLRIKSERHLRLHSDMIISHPVAQFIIRFCLFSLLRSPWGWSSEFHWPR